MHAHQTRECTILKIKIDHFQDLDYQKTNALSLVNAHIDLMKSMFKQSDQTQKITLTVPTTVYIDSNNPDRVPILTKIITNTFDEQLQVQPVIQTYHDKKND
jgi:hypothetical protein